MSSTQQKTSLTKRIKSFLLKKTNRKERQILFKFYFVTGGVIFLFSLVELAIVIQPASSIIGISLGLFLMLVAYSWVLIDLDRRIEDLEYKV